MCVYRFPPFTLFTLHWQLLLFTKITFLPFCSCQLLRTHSGTNVRKLIQKGQTKQGDCLKCHNKTLCLIGRRVGGQAERRGKATQLRVLNPKSAVSVPCLLYLCRCRLDVSLRTGAVAECMPLTAAVKEITSRPSQ